MRSGFPPPIPSTSRQRNVSCDSPKSTAASNNHQIGSSPVDFCLYALRGSAHHECDFFSRLPTWAAKERYTARILPFPVPNLFVPAAFTRLLAPHLPQSLRNTRVCRPQHRRRRATQENCPLGAAADFRDHYVGRIENLAAQARGRRIGLRLCFVPRFPALVRQKRMHGPAPVLLRQCKELWLDQEHGCIRIGDRTTRLSASLAPIQTRVNFFHQSRGIRLLKLLSLNIG